MRRNEDANGLFFATIAIKRRFQGLKANTSFLCLPKLRAASI
jgi:hypothetical protein